MSEQMHSHHRPHKREIVDGIFATADSLKAIADALKPPLTSTRLILKEVSINRNVIRGDIRFMILKNNQQAEFKFGKPIDAKGNEAEVENVSTEVVDGVSGHIIPHTADPANPLWGIVVADNNTPNQSVPTTVRCKADSDLGEGVRPIEGFFPLLVTSSEAVGFGPAEEGEPFGQ